LTNYLQRPFVLKREQPWSCALTLAHYTMLIMGQRHPLPETSWASLWLTTTAYRYGDDLSPTTSSLMRSTLTPLGGMTEKYAMHFYIEARSARHQPHTPSLCKTATKYR